VLRIPLLQGRLWEQPEVLRGATLALVNQSMARQFFPNRNVLGQQVRFPNLKDQPPYNPGVPDPGAWLQIIGVVADARDDGLRNPVKPAIFVPFTLRLNMFTQILVRTQVPPLSILHDIRAQLVQIDREQQVMQVRDLQTWIENQQEYGEQRFVATLFAVFAFLALSLAAVGLYSVVSYGVATRTNEFGIRIALGARAADVFRMVLTSTSLNVAAGLVAGIAISFALDKLATKWVFESSRDPLILAGVSIVLVAAALLASFVPARRAASVDPMEALRHD
jgi:putative ABC transport system permease protein